MNEVIAENMIIQVVTKGTQGPAGPPFVPTGFTGSINVPLQYGGIFNITTQNGLVVSMGIYGM